MAEGGIVLLRQLCADAGSLDEFLATRGMNKPARTEHAGSAAGNAAESGSAADVEFGVAAITFLLEKGALDMDDYPAWIEVAIAFKNTFGEAGFSAWLTLSEAAEGFESDETCRKAWDGIKERPDGESKRTIGTYIAQAKELGWKPPRRGKKSSDASDGMGPPGKGEDLAAYTVNLVAETGDEFWLDQEAKAHVTYEAELADGSTVKRHLPVLGSTYRNVLQERFFDAAEGLKTLKDEQAAGAASLLAMRARRSGVQHFARLRVGEHEGKLYVDLGTDDGQAVEIDAAGFRVVDEPPVRFIRGMRGALPIPELGGTLADFETHFNLTPDDLQRCLGFIVGAFNLSGSYAILITDGEQGSCKSTLNDKVLGLSDPPHQAKSARMSFNSKEQDLHILAQSAHVLSFDNVSTLDADSADMLCRVATGGASSSRELYSNDRLTQFVVSRPVILTCIGVPSTRADLLDRSVRITAQPVTRRLTEEAVQAAFASDQPKLLGFVFSCVSAALANREVVKAAIADGTLELPRMADFAAFVEGAHDMLGLPLGGFSALLQAGQSAMQIESVTGDPVGAGLVAYFSSPNPTELNASASDLLRMLKERAPTVHRWPAANGFSKRLKRIAVGLRHLGIEFEITEASGHDNVAKFRIWATPAFQAQSTTSSEHDWDDGGGYF